MKQRAKWKQHAPCGVTSEALPKNSEKEWSTTQRTQRLHKRRCGEPQENGKNKWIQIVQENLDMQCAELGKSNNTQSIGGIGKGNMVKMERSQLSIFLVPLGKLSKYFRRVVPTKVAEVARNDDDEIQATNGEHVENMWAFLAKVSLRQGTLSWTREQHHKAHEQGVVPANSNGFARNRGG